MPTDPANIAVRKRIRDDGLGNNLALAYFLGGWRIPVKRPGWRTLSASLSMIIAIAVTYVLSTHALAQKSNSPFAGRWDFDIESPRGISARWLGVTEKDGALEVWYQPGSGLQPLLQIPFGWIQLANDRTARSVHRPGSQRLKISADRRTVISGQSADRPDTQTLPSQFNNLVHVGPPEHFFGCEVSQLDPVPTGQSEFEFRISLR